MSLNDRQERRLMRQRGAGTRELKNATFGFSFGAPASLQSRPSSRRTPRALPPQPSTRKTPTALPPKSSTRKTPARSSSQVGDRSTRRQRSVSVATFVGQVRERSASVAVSSAGRASTGKLRLPARTPRGANQVPLGTPSVTGKRKRGQQSLELLQEEEQDELERDDEEHTTSIRKPITSIGRTSIGKQPAVEAPPSSFVDAPDELEQDDETHQVSSAKRRPERPQTRGGDKHGTSHAEKSSSDVLTSPSVRNTRAKGKNRLSTGQVTQSEEDHETPRRASRRVAAAEERHALEESVQEQGPRESRLQPRTPGVTARKQAKRLPKGEAATLNGTGRQSRRANSPKPTEEEQQEEEGLASADELSPINQQIPNKAKKPVGPNKAAPQKRSAVEESDDDLSPEKQPQQQRRKSAKSTTSNQEERAEETAEEEAEDAEEESEENAEEPRQTRPALATKSPNAHNSPQKRNEPSTKTKRRPTDPPTTAPQPKRRKRSSATTSTTVPITVYRLTQPAAADENDDTDPLHAPPSAPTRLPGVNPIDVLAQVTSELITLTSSRLSRGSSAKSSARTRSAITSFSSHLSDTLFTLTTASDTSATLAARLRHALKQKHALRDEYLALRQRRHELGRQIDAVRAAHASRRRKWEEERAVLEGVWDLDVAVKRGKEKARVEGREDEGPEWGVEGLLGSVGERVSGVGGVFGRVREFNEVLETGVEVLGRG